VVSTWIPSTTKPDADLTVLCWRTEDGFSEWFAGWWDAAGSWFDCATGGRVEGVSHWADVDSPIAALAQPEPFKPDWTRIEALEASLREHMAEIHRLKALAQPDQGV
jgi:hypothetical protein